MAGVLPAAYEVTAVRKKKVDAERRRYMTQFAAELSRLLTKYKYFDGAVTAHQFLTLLKFRTGLANVLRSANLDFEMKLHHCYGNRTKKIGTSAGKAPVFSGLWLTLQVKIPSGQKFPRKGTREVAAECELDRPRSYYGTYGGMTQWYITVWCHRRSFDERLAEIPPTEVDWRPTETIPEDYYAM